MTSLLLLFCLPSTLLLLSHALRPVEEGVKSGGGILLVDFDGSDFFDDGVIDGGGIDDEGIGDVPPAEEDALGDAYTASLEDIEDEASTSSIGTDSSTEALTYEEQWNGKMGTVQILGYKSSTQESSGYGGCDAAIFKFPKIKVVAANKFEDGYPSGC